MNKKIILIIEIIIMCLIVCIGFSSWLIVLPMNSVLLGSNNGKISSENAFVFDDYIKIAKTEPFTLTPIGFSGLNPQWESSIKTTITIVSLKKCKEFAVDDQSFVINLLLRLSCEDKQNIFSDTNIKISSNKDNAQTFVTNIETSKYDVGVNAKITLNLNEVSQDNTEFTVSFNFNTTNSTGYQRLYYTFSKAGTSATNDTPTGAVFNLALSLSN